MQKVIKVHHHNNNSKAIRSKISHLKKNSQLESFKFMGERVKVIF